MSMRAAAFAIPGDIDTLTGGYIYEKRLLLGLRDAGHDIEHVQLGETFPDPSQSDMDDAVAKLVALAPDRALILDGLVYGSIDPAGFSAVQAPVVAMIHHPLAKETGLSQSQRDHLFETERANLRQAAHVLVPSLHTAHILTSEYGVEAERITIAPPGTDPPRLEPAPIGPPLILAVGIQHPRKGHDLLIDALAHLTHLNWQAVIAGGAHDAEYAALLADTVSERGLTKRITLAGRVPRDALRVLYSQATIFTLATRYEGYGIVFDEALSWGLPIISCRTGAVPDTVPDSAGLLVPTDDVGALAAAIAKLLTDIELRERLAKGAKAAGQNLPGWDDTSRIASGVLNAL